MRWMKVGVFRANRVCCLLATSVRDFVIRIIMDRSKSAYILGGLLLSSALVSLGQTYLEQQQRQRDRRGRFRRFGVHPIIRKRNQHGFYSHLYKELREDDGRFFGFVRMTTKQFDNLLQIIEPHLPVLDTQFHQPMPNDLRLFLTLRFLAGGDSVLTIAYAFRVGVSTCHTIIHTFCEAIFKGLYPNYLKPPSSPEDFKKIAEGFEKNWNLPHCIGAVDGKHVSIKRPRGSGSLNYNYKHFYSIVLMAVCDSEYCFTMIDVGAEGGQSDGGVFRDSELGNRIINNLLPEPSPEILPHSDTKCPFFYIGDEAFALRNNFLTPYGGDQVKGFTENAIEKKIYNYRLSRARRVIENCFGILASRWRIFRRTIEAEGTTAKLITNACVGLHNYLMKTKHIGLKNTPPGFYGDKFVPDQIEPVVEGVWRQESDVFKKLKMKANKNPAFQPRKVREIMNYYLNHVFQLKHQRDIVLQGYIKKPVTINPTSGSDSDDE